jgi:hypothetical protein
MAMVRTSSGCLEMKVFAKSSGNHSVLFSVKSFGDFAFAGGD